MLVFIDFEASSLGKKSYPIEVGWVFENGVHADYLIKPAPGWNDWDPDAEAIHGISREIVEGAGFSHDEVARIMLRQLAGHDLIASAPSWDGKWLSALLRAAGYPRRTLRLRGTDELIREEVQRLLGTPVIAPLEKTVVDLLGSTGRPDAPPAHRALPDAERERLYFLSVREALRTHAFQHRR